MGSRPGYPGERAHDPAVAPPDGVRVAQGSPGPSDGIGMLPFTRRGFFARASTAALAAFAAVAGAPDLARADGPASATPSPERPQPSPCRVRCEPITRTGCACGGYLYRCTGCGTSFHACIDGKPFTWVCLRRSC